MAIFSNPLFVTYSVYARNASIILNIFFKFIFISFQGSCLAVQLAVYCLSFQQVSKK